jgi:alkylation response protein AidB-like acyl-CoA dehydrogenase
MATKLATVEDQLIEDKLSPEKLAWITQRLGETAERYDRSGEFPRENFDLLASEGLIGLTVARHYGGRGANLSQALRVLGAVAKGEPSTALILFMTYAYHSASAKTRNWPGDLYERVAREAVLGQGLIGAFRVEPELGTPVRGGLPATTARRTADGGWALSGVKIYSTGSTGLHWFVVWAKTDEAQPRVGSFLVRPNSPGIVIEPAWDHLGMRATVSHAVHFNETPVPAEHAVDVRLPEEWAQAADPSQAIWNALAISTIYDGVARAARDWLRDYLNDRVPTNLGASLATLPRVQEKFGEIDALLQVNRTLIEAAAARTDAGDPPGSNEANIIKYVATGNAIRAVEIGLELTGNPGISRKNPLERHYRDVLCSRIHSPQTDTILVAAGRAGLGV